MSNQHSADSTSQFGFRFAHQKSRLFFVNVVFDTKIIPLRGSHQSTELWKQTVLLSPGYLNTAMSPLLGLENNKRPLNGRYLP